MATKEDKDKKKERNTKGQFEKGRAKTGGRKLGTKNLAPKGNLRDRLREQLEPLMNNLAADLMKVHFPVL